MKSCCSECIKNAIECLFSFPSRVGRSGGISVTEASGSPYPHGAQSSYRMPPNGPGFAPSGPSVVPQPLRTIQPTPKMPSSLPGYYNPSGASHMQQQHPSHQQHQQHFGLNEHRGPGVSFTPGGSTKFAKMGAHDGSMESLNSTQSLTISMGSTASAGSSHGPLKPSLKKPYLGERGSVTSEGSAKHVKLSIGGEQTAV
eukprot:TRINITY_DN1351_c0_g1_i6.p1 TRINITY_DN1351_c0_g1~~TRINITY_DN1351_c0_g1_i6.p1  ORF type:complete len:199 (-),score=50.36 TRINITY_DN1351_c0_g1_i6:283-879(-)